MWAVKDYEEDIMKKINFSFKSNSLFLDIGCGNGDLTKRISKKYGLKSIGIDIVSQKEWNSKKEEHINFFKSSAYELPFKDNYFDYVFLKDILHHVDEPKHNKDNLKLVFEEIKRITRSDGTIIIVEANRYNPIFYFHMTLLKGHDHFNKKFFTSLINANFKQVTLTSFESHVYPSKLFNFFKLYEYIMEKTPLLNMMLSYKFSRDKK